ncbi:helix-turn-helix domain-containing protein [Paenibacillus sp. P26]|nr:helix-turn-helix domain-containing protein [Paenibacillus sp. P26]
MGSPWDGNRGEAEDGLEAIRLIESLGPELVITDMRMPGMDGIELLKELRERFPSTQIIVISGYDDFMYTKQAILAQAKDYLLKPIDPKELNAVLERCRAQAEPERGSGAARSLDIELFQMIKNAMPALSLHVAELNAAKAEAALKQLGTQLEAYRPLEAFELERIFQEYMLLLSDLMAKNLLEHPPQALDAVSFTGCTGMIEALTKAYVEAIEQLIDQRKYKSKLNLNEIKAYINHNFMGPLTVESIAQAFFVSNVYLSRAFKGEFGLTITEYIQHLRMERAKTWILDHQTPIKTVAEMCGYEDVGYFYRVFKKHFGVAPGEMRKG